jgi:diguanylate cyclase (GGDEF)-like protein
MHPPPADAPRVPDGTYGQLANSMLGAVLAYVNDVAGEAGVEEVRREAGETRTVAEIQDANGWSSYAQGLALFKAAAKVLDDPDVGRKAGMEVLRQYAGSEVMGLLRSLGSPAEMLRVYPSISAKQSTVTRSEVIEVGDDHGIFSVVTTPPIKRDPIFCAYTAGAISQFPVLFGMEPAVVEEPECQTRGAPQCVFKVRWDPTSSFQTNAEREVQFLREQVDVLTVRFRSLEEVACDLSSARDVDEILEKITQRAGVAVRAPRHLLAVRLPGEPAFRVHSVGFSNSEADVTAADILVADPHADDSSRLMVDVASARTHFGRLAAFFPDGYKFLPQERDLLLAYAGHAAAALETTAALDESRERNATLSALLALGKALTQVRSRQEVAEHLVEAIPEVVGCDEVHVLLWDAGDAALNRVASGSSRPTEEVAQLPGALRGEGLVSRLLESSEPMVASSTSDAILQGVLALTGLSEAIFVSLTARGEFFGVVAVGSREAPLSAGAVLRDRLTGVAGLAATALDGAMLLDEVRHQALHDPTTDLANARLFEDRVSQAIAVARRNGARHGLLFVDLDRFKLVNDTRGHKVGDELLRAVAQRLVETVREEDTVARIGGDEFGVLLQTIDSIEDAESVARKIIVAIGAPFIVRGSSLSVGASVGIALLPTDSDTYEAVISRADSAMYEAKANGRGQFCVYQR